MSIQLLNLNAPKGAHLEQMSGGQNGRIFELNATRLTLGRNPECDLVIEAEGVSRVHALLVQSEGAWFIRDNKSKNGLYVNGELLKESWLESGDIVQIGTFVFRFQAGQVLESPPEGNLPSELPIQAAKKAPVNKRVLIYVGVLVVLGAVLMMGGEPEKSAKPAGDVESPTSGAGLARDFKTAEKPTLELGTKSIVPLGMEDPLLKKVEQEMAQLDWSNSSLRESEQFFRRGQREYLAKNYHRAIEAFQTALSVYGGHLLAERYLRRAVYEAEIEAKNHMAMGIQYYESLQYARAIHHFNEAISLMAHRPNEAIVKEAGRYIKQSELRLQAAELFP